MSFTPRFDELKALSGYENLPFLVVDDLVSQQADTIISSHARLNLYKKSAAILSCFALDALLQDLFETSSEIKTIQTAWDMVTFGQGNDLSLGIQFNLSINHEDCSRIYGCFKKMLQLQTPRPKKKSSLSDYE